LLVAVIIALGWPDLRLPAAPLAGDRADLWLHGLGFLALGTLAGLGWPSRRGRLFLVLALLALALEGLQVVVPGRSVSASDAAANLVGLTVAFGLPGRGYRGQRWSSWRVSREQRRCNTPAGAGP